MKKLITVFLFCVVGCSSLSKKDEVKIGNYVSPPEGFSTNSFWLEGPDGLILIDTQFLLSAGKAAVESAEKATGKKVVLAIVLHPNPDKFNGVGQLQKKGIKVITSQQVRDLIPSVHKDRHYWFYDRYKPDYPDKYSLPDSFGSQTVEIKAAGLKLKLHVLKAACSEAHVVVEYNRNIFVGDIIANRGHAWLELGLINEWLERIKELKKLKPEYVHPGRGASGGPELLEKEEAYLLRVKKYVMDSQPRKNISEKEKEKILGEIQERIYRDYPDYTNPYFVEIGLPEVWNKLITK